MLILFRICKLCLNSHLLIGTIKAGPPCTGCAYVPRFLHLHYWRTGFGCSPLRRWLSYARSPDSRVYLCSGDFVPGGTITLLAPTPLVWGAEFQALLLWDARRTGVKAAYAPRSASKATAASLAIKQFAPAVTAILGSIWQLKLPEQSCSYCMDV